MWGKAVVDRGCIEKFITIQEVYKERMAEDFGLGRIPPGTAVDEAI